ncbi:MAG: hypothetical protein ACXIUM_12780 [Wenzhouxiangella sp.]
MERRALSIEINPERTALNPQARWHLAGSAAVCLPRMLAALES